MPISENDAEKRKAYTPYNWHAMVALGGDVGREGLRQTKARGAHQSTLSSKNNWQWQSAKRPAPKTTNLKSFSCRATGQKSKREERWEISKGREGKGAWRHQSVNLKSQNSSASNIEVWKYWQKVNEAKSESKQMSNEMFIFQTIRGRLSIFEPKNNINL